MFSTVWCRVGGREFRAGPRALGRQRLTLAPALVIPPFGIRLAHGQGEQRVSQRLRQTCLSVKRAKEALARESGLRVLVHAVGQGHFKRYAVDGPQGAHAS